MKSIRKIICIAVAGLALAAVSSMAEEKAEKGKEYPLDTCVVSGETLGEMGKPFVFEHDGKEVQLCCKSCKKKFDKDPEKFMKKLEEAKAKK